MSDLRPLSQEHQTLMDSARFRLLSLALCTLPLLGTLLFATAMPTAGAAEALPFTKPALPAALTTPNAPKTFLMPEEAF